MYYNNVKAFVSVMCRYLIYKFERYLPETSCLWTLFFPSVAHLFRSSSSPTPDFNSSLLSIANLNETDIRSVVETWMNGIADDYVPQ